MGERHPDFDAEQRYLLGARQALEQTIAHVRTLLATARADTHDPDARALAANLVGRVQRLEDAGSQAACFGRLDDEADDTLYIGRQHIAAADQTPLVIDWRARAAAPFYRATPLQTMGCTRRRQFVLDADTLIEIYDTDLTDPEAAAGIPDPLLAEINRARTGSMREIVATIQAEQDRIVRAPLDRTLVVQGGPGTGKTAVGLHRAAFLLFEHREQLHREGVLVVGPNQRFLDYISDVLPSLGERRFRQIVPRDLADIDLPDADHLDPEHRRLCGDLRMIAAIRAHLENAALPPTDDVRIRSEAGSGTIVSSRARDAMAAVLSESDRVGPARELWLSGLIADLRDHAREFGAGTTTTASEFAAAVRRSETFVTFAKSHWPATKPMPAVRSFWRAVAADDAVLRAAGFGPGEIEVLRRPAKRWVLCETDRALLDEAAWQLGHRFVDYGHVILDEAQDLSPMALRMVARRAKGRSFTVLGDVAQCSGDWLYADWEEPLRALSGASAAVELAELTVGYRVPDEFIHLANGLLPAIAPDLTETTSVRPALDPPTWTQADAGALGDAVVAAVHRLSPRWESIAVITADTARTAVEEALRAAGSAGGADVMSPREAKGLEFDAVVVVEPAAMRDHAGSWRPLFVALTRAVQHLEMLGAEPPPEEVASRL